MYVSALASVPHKTDQVRKECTQKTLEICSLSQLETEQQSFSFTNIQHRSDRKRAKGNKQRTIKKYYLKSPRYIEMTENKNVYIEICAVENVIVIVAKT